MAREVPNGRHKAGKMRVVHPDETAASRAGWTAWLWLLPLVTVLPYALSKLHYSLPAALPPRDASGRAQPSEEVVLGHIKALEDIGYRTVGTWEAYHGEQYVLSEVRKLEKQCNARGVLRCEVWLQKGSGCHQFSILDHDVLKMYEGISNVIMRISAPGRQRGEKDTVLLGSHIDSAIPAPGAADDGIGVGVMLDVARVIIERNEPFDAAVLFVWNGAEETLQDGSHMYSVDHETAKDVRAVINLEAAGTTGGALLFQATSAEMIEAFSHAPHPRGTVAASDVFASGIMMSDTDFGQFEQYMNVSGLDFALVGHSYFYHTRGDVLAHITPGSAQHFSSNVFAIVEHLLSPGTPLLSPEPWHQPDIVYLSLYDRLYLSWTMASANVVYGAMTGVVAVLAGTRLFSAPRVFWLSLFGNLGGFILGIVGANALAAVLHFTGFRQAWFRHEHLSCLFYAPPAFAAAFASQHFLSRRLPPLEQRKLEKAYLYSHLITACLSMSVLQAFHIRSAYFFALITLILLVVVLCREVAVGPRATLVLGYGPGLIAAIIVLVEAVTTINDIFVPLTGRMGKEAPAEFIIAVISSSTSMIFMPLAFPLFHRLSRPAQRRVIFALLGLTAIVVGYFAGPAWPKYDPMHPKRVAVQYTFNHTSGDSTLHVCTMDRGDELHVPEKLFEKYGAPSATLQPTSLTPYETDWDVIYPVSSFLDTWRFDLVPATKVDTEFEWPKMGWEVVEKDTSEGRTLSFKLNFTELVFPTVAFEADIASWSFDIPPPIGKKRHHFKIAASVDTPVVDMELTIRDAGKIRFDWSAIDGKQMVPGTAAKRGPERPGSKLLIEADEWMAQEWNGALDILMFATVTGSVEV